MRSRFGGAIQRAPDGQPRNETASVSDLDCHYIGEHSDRKKTAVEIRRTNQFRGHANKKKKQSLNFE